ncbi:MAG: RluA family pseudouridine synthase [Chthoniobacterales bacterium]
MSIAEITGEGLSASTSAAANTSFTIVDETADYAVVDKPPFLLMHPTKPNGARTLWSELRELFAFEIANGGRISLVNRLDRETSGLVLVAKNSETARRFGLLMQQQQIAKQYLAIVWGWPDWDRRLVDAPLVRQGVHGPSAIWLKQAVHPLGATAGTELLVEHRFVHPTTNGDRFSLIRAVPRTGRTHQIRVHLAGLGHAIVGDKIYGPDEQLYLKLIDRGWTDELEEKLLLPHHALHASQLSIGDQTWRSPLPKDLQDWVNAAL